MPARTTRTPSKPVKEAIPFDHRDVHSPEKKFSCENPSTSGANKHNTDTKKYSYGLFILFVVVVTLWLLTFGDDSPAESVSTTTPAVHQPIEHAETTSAYTLFPVEFSLPIQVGDQKYAIPVVVNQAGDLLSVATSAR